VSEFDEWQAYFEQRMSYNDKSDYYAAATIRAIFASQGAKVSRNINDFLLDFKKPDQDEDQDSRSLWLRALGVKQETE
jgi:hypothetical protein